jgi:hypothetical protein
LGLAPVTP